MMCLINQLGDDLNLFQRIIFVLLFVASVTQAQTAAMVPVMETSMAAMQTMPTNMAHCESMTQSDGHMTDNDCQQDCHCCANTCSSVFIVIEHPITLVGIELALNSFVPRLVPSRQTSLYRPPISA